MPSSVQLKSSASNDRLVESMAPTHMDLPKGRHTSQLGCEFTEEVANKEKTKKKARKRVYVMQSLARCVL